MVSVNLEPRLPSAAVWLGHFNELLLAPLFYVGILTYFLTGRHQIHLHVGPSGLTMEAFGRRRLHLPWGDVDRIGIVAHSDPKEHNLIVWPRPGTTWRRSAWLPFQRQYGGLSILPLESYRITAPPEQIDQAIARYAGQRYSRMALLRQTAPGKQ
ncbi:hypothetical protein [Streptomyces sp. NRRL S-813]|uniref:hypothetical protein n=1 Tax=Streptomyces sp. NRRL S-813 TaxID=1463919 RepID=UPI00131E06B1|nr:hypothetical protein [Streptomyces sp. NRRL S-813]